MTGQSGAQAAIHPLEFILNPTPHALDMVCAGTGVKVDKIFLVVDHQMPEWGVDGYCFEPVVSCPAIAVDD